MPPSIEISPRTFARLQAHAIPLVDDIESVINRVFDHYESSQSTPIIEAVGPRKTADVKQFNPQLPPDLTYTKVQVVEINGKPLEVRPNWANLMIAVIRIAKNQVQNHDEFKSLMTINWTDQKKEDEGYKFIPDLGISIQGQDANYSWKCACHIAQALGLGLTVTFAWKDKDQAKYPGVTGQFSLPQ
jgi:hypothetical protein